MTVPVEDFSDPLDEQFAAVERAVEGFREGVTSNVAVVAEPFAGRGALLDYGASLLDEEEVVRHRFEGPVTGDLPDLPEADAYVLADCHYLYQPRVGGFAAFDAFVEWMTASESLFLTAWNRHAFSYLAAVRDADRVFPTVVRVPDFDADELADVVETVFGPDLPEYVERGSEGRIKSVEWVRYPVRLWGSRHVGVPVLKPNPEYIRAWASSETAQSNEAVVMEKIRRVSGGNVGVATDLWARSVTDGEIATGDVEVLAPAFDFEEDGATMLRLLVTMESVPRSAIEAVIPDGPVDALVQHLVEEGVLERDGDTVMLTPQGLGPAVAELQRRRLLW